jgi:hypothetical protein
MEVVQYCGSNLEASADGSLFGFWTLIGFSYGHIIRRLTLCTGKGKRRARTTGQPWSIGNCSRDGNETVSRAGPTGPLAASLKVRLLITFDQFLDRWRRNQTAASLPSLASVESREEVRGGTWRFG